MTPIPAKIECGLVIRTVFKQSAAGQDWPPIGAVLPV